MTIKKFLTQKKSKNLRKKKTPQLDELTLKKKRRNEIIKARLDSFMLFLLNCFNCFRNWKDDISYLLTPIYKLHVEQLNKQILIAELHARSAPAEHHG